MNIKMKQIDSNMLEDYSKISIAFKVNSILKPNLIDNGLGGIKLVEEIVDKPYIKDYDSLKEGSPVFWTKEFDISNWGIFIAYDGDREVAGATVAYNTSGVNMLEGRNDLAVLWDIRVDDEYRGKGIGKKLFEHTLNWAKEKDCKLVKIETQNINVKACEFYKNMGCKLGAINRYGYINCPEVEDETMLLWYYEL